MSSRPNHIPAGLHPNDDGNGRPMTQFRASFTGGLLALAVVAMVAAGCGGTKAASTTTAKAKAPASATKAEAKIDPKCSGSGVTATYVSDASLAPAVEKTRQALFTAAIACDYATLNTLLKPAGENFIFTLGTDTDAIKMWKGLESSGQQPMRILAQLLTMKPGTLLEGPAGAQVKNTVWPSVYASTSASAQQWTELAQSGVFTKSEVATMRAQGQYTNYRVGIAPSGTWVYFVAGE